MSKTKEFFVEYQPYCHRCIHKDENEHSKKCSECLENPVNEGSVKPVNFEESNSPR